MSANFMLDLFRGELLSNGEKLKAAFNVPFVPQNIVSALSSLKSSSTLLGFSKLASLLQKLEKFFSHSSGKSPLNKDVSDALSIILKLGEPDSDKIPEALKSADPDIDAIIAAEFRLPEKDVQSTSETQSAENTDSKVQELGAGSKNRIIRPKIDSAMKPLFLQETRTRLESLSSELVELERDFSNFSKIEALMRASHSLKGAARVVGLDDIVRLAHQMENCFVAAQAGKISLKSSDIDVFLECADFLSNLCGTEFDEIDASQLDSIYNDLLAIEQGRLISVKPPKISETASQKIEKDVESSVRISAKNLNSMMELAAESLIENRRIETFREAMGVVKVSHEQTVRQFDEALNALEGIAGTAFAVSRMEQLRRTLRAGIEGIRTQMEAMSDYSRRNVILSGRLYSEVLAARMRPFSEGLQGFPRMVRDIARNSGKKILLEISGADVHVDRDVLEKLDAPITHILRNACDHGIEMPEERTAAGKNPTGTIRIRAWHSAGLLMLKISDDGRGIDEDRIRKRILEKRLTTSELLDRMSRNEVFEFIFLPGFSTKDSVSEMSGRGVGLDIVQTMLREVGGTISLFSERGLGASFTLKLPVARSVMKALTVGVDSQPYAFPLAFVHRIVKISSSDIVLDESGRRIFRIGDEPIYLVDTSKVLGFSESAADKNEFHAVAVVNRGRIYGFIVDSIPAESELVVRPIDKRIGKIPCVSAASLDENGNPVLILDAEDLTVYADRLLSSGEIPQPTLQNVSEVSKRRTTRVLVVDDSATVREIQRKILEAAGFSVDLAVDGADGWNMFRLSKYDLVVSDIDMPRMGGFELVRRIRSRNREIPVVIVSYKDRGEDRAKGMSAGADRYLTKSSFQDDSFIKTIRGLLDE